MIGQRPESRSLSARGGAGSAIPLFLPRVSVVVVAANFPVAGLVVFDELDAGDPLGALPEIEVGNEATDRGAVCEREGFAVEAVRDERVVRGRFLERHVCGEAVPGL